MQFSARIFREPVAQAMLEDGFLSVLPEQKYDGAVLPLNRP